LSSPAVWFTTVNPLLSLSLLCFLSLCPIKNRTKRQQPELGFYGFQLAMENIHSETYSLLIDTYIKVFFLRKTAIATFTTFSVLCFGKSGFCGCAGSRREGQAVPCDGNCSVHSTKSSMGAQMD
jgi:hypothetical protein